MTTLPRSAYIHIPFCRHRCGYCNFSLVAGRDHLIDRFLGALKTEIGQLSQRYEIDTLFLGGGTPSHLSLSGWQRLRQIIESRFELTADAEVTAECNPNDITPEKAGALAEFGINRISLGVQSFNPHKLKRLERDHQQADVENAVRLVRAFARSISFDLIFAAPEEPLVDWQSDLDTALKLNPDHLSTYELTYEKGTQFWSRKSRGELSESDEDIRADMYLAAIDAISSAGLPQYEISSFARPAHKCKHNLIYWSGDPYFAFGPGASRYVGGVRETNHGSTTEYLKRIESGQSAVNMTEQLSPRESAQELLAIGLRTVAGVAAEAFAERTGFGVADLLSDKGPAWIDAGLLQHREQRWSLTDRGRLVADRIAVEIIDS